MPTRPDVQVEVEALPWSVIGPTFIQAWGRSRGKSQPEHVEITGQTGSGKTYFTGTILQERAAWRGTSEILIATKPDDDTIPRLGWPIVDTWAGVCKYRWSVFWPRTTAVGEARKKHHEQKLYELLERLWHPHANTVVAFDEIRYVEKLSARLKELVQMYWREARSQGIPIVAQAQRPVGMVRDQHSETAWKVVFPPADEDDMERFAQLLGPPHQWTPVLEDLDQQRHEFVIRNTVTKEAFVSWIDTELRPIPAQRDQEPTERTPPYRRRRRHAA